jgi:ABC-type sugar transport system permease subunit
MKTYSYDAVVIGSGASGYAAACRIADLGNKSVCIVTEGINCGTSRNTGSDKQTYYKLSLSGSESDSVRKMAQTLFDGGCVDGDTALCEAALSARCYYSLCEAGVPFPSNRFGESVGYKTDHDPLTRATSAGPLTSKFMTEALERKAQRLGSKIFDKLFTVEILQNDGEACGVICLDTEKGEYVAFSSPNVIMATGGPAGIYSDSVYPECHHGMTSLALKAGAKLQNMTEWQYGLASKNPRWNVSGTYMQVLPRIVSVDEAGHEREFLWEYFFEPYEAMSMVFMKGYQWPFDIKKVRGGSSVIDLLVYRETVMRGRKVYLDYTKNPFGIESIDFLGTSEWFRPLYIGSGMWSGAGYAAIVYTAAIAGIDPGLYEASKLDGANRWHRLLHITLPCLVPTIATMLILRIGNVMSVGYEKVLLMQTGATNDVADILSTYTYRIGILDGQSSYAAAIGLFNSVVNLILIIVANATSRKLTESSLW